MKHHLGMLKRISKKESTPASQNLARLDKDKQNNDELTEGIIEQKERTNIRLNSNAEQILKTKEKEESNTKLHEEHEL